MMDIKPSLAANVSSHQINKYYEVHDDSVDDDEDDDSTPLQALKVCFRTYFVTICAEVFGGRNRGRGWHVLRSLMGVLPNTQLILHPN